MKKTESLLISIVILIVGLLVIFFGARKVNYKTDEVWNYGLANNIGSILPEIEYGKAYTDMGPFKDFVEVKSDSRFNYINVYKNQASDVHPPLYYMIFHTVCSFFPESYSKWYGIGVNLFLMILILVFLYKLVLEITDDAKVSLGFILIYGTTVAFIDTLLFIRMYAQFTFFSVVISLLFKHYWDRELGKKFYFQLIATLVCGALTHYYFLIIAFALFISFLIHLMVGRKKVEIRKTIISAICSGVLFCILWSPGIVHLFFGYRGQEAMQKAISLSTLISGPRSMVGVMNSEVFAGLIYVFILIGIINLIIRYKKGYKFNWNFETGLFLSGLFYIAVVGKIAPFIEIRYIMAVFFIFSMAAYLVTISLLKQLLKSNYASICVTIAFIVINIYNFATRNFYAPMDNYSKEYIYTVELAKNLNMVYCLKNDEQWGLFDGFGVLPNAMSYVICDFPDIGDYVSQLNSDYLLGIYDNDGEILSHFALTKDDAIYSIGSAYYYLITVN